MKEIWKPITGNPMYEVSNLGRIRSMLGRYASRPKGYILRQYNGMGYLRVALRPNKNLTSVHRIVAQEFIGECPAGMQVNHKDRNRQNNRVDNLEYVTAKENTQHAHKLGINYACGESKGTSKLTLADVLEIRKLLSNGSLQSDIAKNFGVSISCISFIKLGKRWSRAIAAVFIFCFLQSKARAFDVPVSSVPVCGSSISIETEEYVWKWESMNWTQPVGNNLYSIEISTRFECDSVWVADENGYLNCLRNHGEWVKFKKVPYEIEWFTMWQEMNGKIVILPKGIQIKCPCTELMTFGRRKDGAMVMPEVWRERGR